MKHALRTLLLLILAIGILPLLPSCTNDGKAALIRTANVALTGATIAGYVTPAQAELARKHGALILNAEDGDAKIVAISEAIVEGGIISGKITPEQAADLRAAGTVPLEPPAPIPGSDPPLAVEVTSSK